MSKILPQNEHQLDICGDSIFGRVGFSVTLDSLLMLSNSIANYCAHYNINNIYFGYDSSTWGKLFVEEVLANRLHNLGYQITLIDGSCPIFQLSWTVKQQTELTKGSKDTLGIYVGTDSSYPDNLSIHFRNSEGFPLTESEVATIVSHSASTAALLECPEDDSLKIDLSEYSKYLLKLRLFPKSGLKSSGKINIDTMFGSSETLVDEVVKHFSLSGDIFNRATVPNRIVNYLPIPTGSFLKWKLDKCQYHFAIDGDGDSVGVLDPVQELEISPSSLYMIFIKYLVEIKKKKGTIYISKALSDRVAVVAKHYGLRVKWVDSGVDGFSQALRRSDKRSALMYGDETGGFWFKGDTPDRNSILTILILVSACNRFNKSPGQLVDVITDELLDSSYHFNFLEVSNQFISKSKLEKLLIKELSPTKQELGNTSVLRTSNDGKIVIIDKKKYKSTIVLIESIDDAEVRNITDYIDKVGYNASKT